MEETVFLYVTYIRTTPERLWTALTSEEILPQYWFGMQLRGGQGSGSTWELRSGDELMDSGEVVEWEPPKRLVRTWFNQWKPEFQSEGRSVCVYELAPAGASVRLTVTHSIDHPGSPFLAAVAEGWPMCLSNLKSLLETGSVALTEHPGH